MLCYPRAVPAALALLLCGNPVALLCQTPAGGAVAGVVYDSVAEVPLAGAVVQMRAATEVGADRYYAATTDSAGRYTLDSVAAGSYLVTFFHPALDALGLESLLHEVVVSAGTVTRLELTVPSPGTVRRLTCHPTTPADSTGLVLGQVRDAESQAPLAGALVTAQWNELSFDAKHGIKLDRRVLTVESDSVGRYAICGVPAGGDVELQAGEGAATSGLVLAAVPVRSLLQQPLAISSRNTREVLSTDSAGLDAGTVLMRGTARLAGTVRSESGQPLKDVELRVLGTAVDGRSADDGTFLLAGLPAGSYLLEARRVGLTPAHVTVSLASGRTAHSDVTVQEAVVLSRQTIYGKPPKNGALERLGAFLRRKQLGFGRFLTRKDFARQKPGHTSDIFLQMTGAQIANPPGRPQIGMIYLRNEQGDWCIANVFVDGTPVVKNLGRAGVTGEEDMDRWVQPDDLMAIEVYNKLLDAPSIYQGNACGSVLLWTTGAFPKMPTNW